jgi:hypothetical protein
VARLNREQLIPVIGEGAPLLGHTGRTVERWVVTGYRGVYLDGLHRPGVGWLTSRAAVWRFLLELAWEDERISPPWTDPASVGETVRPG